MENVVSRFEEIAGMYAGTLAIQTRRGALTYEELNLRANRIGNRVLEETTRNMVMLVYKHGAHWQQEAILGVLKAGKAIVAVNVERRTIQTGQRGFLEHDFMDDSAVLDTIDSAGVDLILTDEHYHARIAEIGAKVKVKVINTSLSFLGDSRNPGVPIRPSDLSAILYTTGSTGEPRAVKRTHLMEWLNITAANSGDGITTGPGDRSTLFRIANPAALGDAFYPLLWGGTLCVRDVFDGDLTEWVLTQRISHFRALGTVFRMLDLERGDFSGVKVVNIGGEMITTKDVENYQRWFTDTCKLVIRYAASECGVITQYVVDKSTNYCEGCVGFPVGEKRVSIINPDRAGIGEIAVTDRPGGLFSGYLGNPALTQRKLVDGVFLTGDRGRIADDGALIHLGRIL